MLIARLFGVDVATDAFFVAFKIPNFLRRIFTEGAFSHAFVPMFAEYQAKDQQALKQFVDKSAGALAFWLMVVTIIGVSAAPILVWCLAPGFDFQGQPHQLAVTMLRITLPYLVFIGLVAFAGSLLNAQGQFLIPATAPALLNICMIAAAIWLAPHLSEPVTALAWGVFAAGCTQLLLQIPALIRLGLLPRLRFTLNDAEVKRAFGQLLPAIFGVSVTQINLLLDTLIASFLVVGSVSWLYYSDRLVEFPLGILGLGLGTVILPHLAKCHAADEAETFSNALDWGLRLVLLTGVPATIGLIVLAEPVLSTLFQYKQFTVQDVGFAAQSLRAYAVGLPAFLMAKVLVPGFTARQDLKTPLRYGIIAMIASLALNILAIPLAHAGLALATSLGACLNATLLLFKLGKENIFTPQHGWWLFLLRILIASIAMTLALCCWVDAAWWQAWGMGERALNLLLWIGVGVVVYAVVLVLSGLRLRHLRLCHGKVR
jgi:putative peptidoglycan lipid II flippase